MGEEPLQGEGDIGGHKLKKDKGGRRASGRGGHKLKKDKGGRRASAR